MLAKEFQCLVPLISTTAETGQTPSLDLNKTINMVLKKKKKKKQADFPFLTQSCKVIMQNQYVLRSAHGLGSH